MSLLYPAPRPDDTGPLPAESAAPGGPSQQRPRCRSRRATFEVFGTPIDAVDAAGAVARVAAWAQANESRYVCICNAHSLVTAQEDPAFRQVISQADMATPDGTPVAWMARRLGWRGQRRVTGPDLMLDYCAHAEAQGEPIFLYGATQETLDRLTARLLQRWPRLRIAGSLAPPFRAHTAAEDLAAVHQINASGARTVWVSLGCPKQEAWMAAHRGRVNAVMIGVGAAFDFHSGLRRRAPAWMQAIGLEWLFRLCSEPRRLWRRYVFTNSRFIMLALRQLGSSASARRPSQDSGPPT